MKYRVWANASDYGEIEAANEQEARDIACRLAGYQSEAHMVDQLEQPSEHVAELVEENDRDRQ